ncbi:uncharacterized protein LAJ45_08702 [Morchella importuna]|uniref:uncharacterized protein n=1 Tax=Morchella importuna TaxID=1174673 RepID=UPI001E8D1D29|nr:uncharacterized protein LAJ45_08702 [Morchella importuna]KAH8147224.1 hypothetical protein LAJ45_08702 [Morchella importuna]
MPVLQRRRVEWIHFLTCGVWRDVDVDGTGDLKLVKDGSRVKAWVTQYHSVLRANNFHGTGGPTTGYELGIVICLLGDPITTSHFITGTNPIAAKPPQPQRSSPSLISY